MSKHKKHKVQQAAPMKELVHSLQFRAEERTDGLGHELGYWAPAKRKKHGAGSMQATCLKCGEVVFISPYLTYSREHMQVPAIKGDALFQLCYVNGTIL